MKDNWMKIFTPVVEHLKLQIRFNVKDRNVEIRTWKETEDIANVQKAADFVKAFVLGFEVDDALALLRYTNQVRSLTQFYSVDFSKSRIGVKKCVFNKRTIKVCVSCC